MKKRTFLMGGPGNIMSEKNIDVLTGLRGLAALIVFVSHLANQGMMPQVLGNGFGQIGVMIFFLLSGFLMGHLYLLKSWDKENVRSFIFSRVGRVFPLYIFIVVVSFFVSTLLYPDFHYEINSFKVFFTAMAFVKAPQELWTIPVEVQFYAFFVVVWFGCKVAKSNFVLPLMAVTSVVPSFLMYYFTGKLLPVFSTYSFVFFIGIGFSYIYRNRIGFDFFSERIRFFLGGAAILLIFISLPSIRLEHGAVYSDDFYLRTWGDPVNWLLVSTLFYAALMNSGSLNFLNGKIFAYLGNISYGFYLIHYPVIVEVNKLVAPQFVKVGIAFLVVTLLAHLSYVFLENPVNKFIRSLNSSGKASQKAEV